MKSLLFSYAFKKNSFDSFDDISKISFNDSLVHTYWLHFTLDNNSLNWIFENNLITKKDWDIISLGKSKIHYLPNAILFKIKNLTTIDENTHPSYIYIYIDNKKIITLRNEKTISLKEIKDEIDSNYLNISSSKDILKRFLMLFYLKAEKHIFRIESLSEELLDYLLDSKNVDIKIELLHLRKKIMQFKKLINIQKESFEKLSIKSFPLFEQKDQEFFDEFCEKFAKLSSNLDSCKETVLMCMDQIHALHDEKLNQNMYYLSIISIIFLPISFLAGLLGVNLNGIPLASTNFSFPLFCIILLIIVSAQIFFLKKSKFIKF